MSIPPLTIGIEEEYQLIDPETRELAPANDELMDRGEEFLPGQLRPEMMRSQIEVGSQVCASVKEARAEMVRLRKGVRALAAEFGLEVVAASTHPFSQWMEQVRTPKNRYQKLEEDLRDVARRLLIFGMHIHVGIEDQELRIDVLNQARYFVPHLLALSTSSPFFCGRDTGLKSYRSVIFENMPRSGISPIFRSWSDYENYCNTLVKTSCIDEPTKIWWDVRPHPKFPTVEFRMSDMCTRIDEMLCIAALTQAVAAKLLKLRRGNRSWRTYRQHLITENKWRAVRYGIDGQLIDFGKQSEAPVKDLINELLEFVDDVVEDLDSREEVDYVQTILEGGTSADRQIATYRKTDDLKAVVDQLIAETREGCD